MYESLLVAVDGSEQSYKALDHAVAIAEKFGSEIILLTVVSPLMEIFLVNESFGLIIDKVIFEEQERRRKLYKNMLKDADEKIRTKHPNLNIRTILREGRPSAIIVDVVEKEGCDMIVMGNRGIGGIKGWVLGSTSHMVSSLCKKSLMVIK